MAYLGCVTNVVKVDDREVTVRLARHPSLRRVELGFGISLIGAQKVDILVGDVLKVLSGSG